MTSKNIFLFLFIIIVIAISGWFYKAFKTVPTLPAYENDLINEQGQTIKIADFKGSYLLISYFQTWCGDCIQELPSIDNLQSTMGKNKLKVVIVSDENFQKINHFKERYCNTLDYYQSLKTLEEQSIRVFPTTYLLNKDGVIIMSKLGRYDWSNAEVLSKIVN
jgi:peroxiredoxin